MQTHFLAPENEFFFKNFVQGKATQKVLADKSVPSVCLFPSDSVLPSPWFEIRIYPNLPLINTAMGYAFKIGVVISG